MPLSNIRTICLCFNLNKPLHKKAFEYLKSMDKSAFKSYTQASALAITEYFERYLKKCNDLYFETREREEQIVAAVGNAVEKALPDLWRHISPISHSHISRQRRRQPNKSLIYPKQTLMSSESSIFGGL